MNLLLIIFIINSLHWPFFSQFCSSFPPYYDLIILIRETALLVMLRCPFIISPDRKIALLRSWQAFKLEYFSPASHTILFFELLFIYEEETI